MALLSARISRCFCCILDYEAAQTAHDNACGRASCIWFHTKRLSETCPLFMTCLKWAVCNCASLVSVPKLIFNHLSKFCFCWCLKWRLGINFHSTIHRLKDKVSMFFLTVNKSFEKTKNVLLCLSILYTFLILSVALSLKPIHSCWRRSILKTHKKYLF